MRRRKAGGNTVEISTKSPWLRWLEQIPTDLNRLEIRKELWVCDSMALDWGVGMPKSYSEDLRERVIEAVEAGAARHVAARQFRVSASSAIRWVQRWRASGEIAAKPRGGSTSPLEDHEAALLVLASEQPDLTLDEFCAVLKERKITTSRVSVWRFFSRHGLSFKKNSARQRAGARRRGRGARALARGSALV